MVVIGVEFDPTASFMSFKTVDFFSSIFFWFNLGIFGYIFISVVKDLLTMQSALWSVWLLGNLREIEALFV